MTDPLKIHRNEDDGDGVIRLGIVCGQCGGSIYMHSCPVHEWAVMSVCQGCLLVHRIGECREHGCSYSDDDVLPRESAS